MRNSYLIIFITIILLGLCVPRIVLEYVDEYPHVHDSPRIRIPEESGIRDPLYTWLDALEEYECLGCGENYSRVDVNGLRSYGCLQFQEQTFKAFVRRYDLLPYAETAEIMNMIYDCDFQKIVAHRMIQENDDAWSHWYTSVELRGLGKPPKLY